MVCEKQGHQNHINSQLEQLKDREKNIESLISKVNAKD